MTMRLACVVSIAGYTPTDLASKRDSLKTILRPDTQLDMFAAASGVPYIESSLEFYLSEAAVARKCVEIAQLGYDAIAGTAFLDNGLDGARELVDIPIVGPAKTSLYLAATLANRFAIIMARGDLAKHVWAFAKVIGVVDRIVAMPTLTCSVTFYATRVAPSTWRQTWARGSWMSMELRPLFSAAARRAGWHHNCQRPWGFRC
jgi:Asp/Glu/hydantoin racemase